MLMIIIHHTLCGYELGPDGFLISCQMHIIYRNFAKFVDEMLCWIKYYNHYHGAFLRHSDLL